MVLTLIAMSSGVSAYDDEKYIYNINEVAKHHNDLYIFPYVGISTSSFINPYLGVNVSAVNLKFLPFVYFNGNFEMYSNISFGFNAQIGATFGKLRNQEQKIIVKSYSGGYRTTINEYIPVYIPIQQSWSVFASARREQMAGNTASGFVENYLFATPPETGVMFYGAGVGLFSVIDYKIQVTKGNDFNRNYNYRGSSNLSVSFLYAPDDGLYQGFAAALDLTSHYKFLSFNFGVVYSFASFQETTFLDKKG